VFHHVIYIIKENRTYDQVLGDDKRGDGDPRLCAFGQKVTPNEHKIATDFLLLDNYYASGKSSAEGHQWTDAAMTTDYIEKSVRGWFRSYPHVQNDAMVYSPSGFLWNDALDHGRTVRIYGEAATPHLQNGEHWKDVYNLYQNGKDLSFVNSTTISRVAPILSRSYPGYDSHRVPDVYRARAFIKELHAYENEPGDELPNLMVIALPADHTAGLRPGYPTPQSMVADNDLALGQIIEAVTKSRFWPTTAIFVTEDDSQDGWDHVSAYRTVGFVVSPYSHLRRTVHTNYNQTSMVRTIEQILGIPPMNMMDASALPMFDCFNDSRDLTPYKSASNQIPLDDMNRELSELNGKAKHYAKKSMEPQFDHIDGGDDDVLNHILWFATMKGKPYPESNVEEKGD
ncbi:MAG TPA: alkaline phosphatase family protein, partial [Balneolales bacterium]|nr:alkaline phosphatase family protein [Balneolales bacterium]